MTETINLADKYTVRSDTLPLPLITEGSSSFIGTTLIVPFGIAALMALYLIARLFMRAG